MPGTAPHGFAEARVDEPFPGVRRRTFDTDRATVARYEFDAGAAFPLHRHPQEQITLIERGEVELTVDGSVERIAAGGCSVIDPGVEHGIRAGIDGASVVAIVIPARSTPDAYTLMGGES